MYKIKIVTIATGYVALLLKRKWLFFGWKVVDEYYNPSMPYSPKVVEWQQNFIIPDNKVLFI